MIGKTIQTLLTNNASLLALVPEVSIFPYVLNENTPLPAIVYTIDSVSPEYTKDGWADDEVGFSVISVSDNYATLQNIIAQVRVALEIKKGTYGAITIGRIELDGLSEGFNITENVFMNKLSFNVTVTNY
jgi:hypothetical protein